MRVQITSKINDIYLLWLLPQDMRRLPLIMQDNRKVRRLHLGPAVDRVILGFFRVSTVGTAVTLEPDVSTPLPVIVDADPAADGALVEPIGPSLVDVAPHLVRRALGVVAVLHPAVGPLEAPGVDRVTEPKVGADVQVHPAAAQVLAADLEAEACDGPCLFAPGELRAGYGFDSHGAGHGCQACDEKGFHLDD
jgi:hypothetical protein